MSWRPAKNVEGLRCAEFSPIIERRKAYSMQLLKPVFLICGIILELAPPFSREHKKTAGFPLPPLDCDAPCLFGFIDVEGNRPVEPGKMIAQDR